jgi:hypothetical protein
VKYEDAQSTEKLLFCRFQCTLIQFKIANTLTPKQYQIYKAFKALDAILEWPEDQK